jgi:hypothetical protein
MAYAALAPEDVDLRRALTGREAAAQFGLRSRSLRAAAKAGRVPSYRTALGGYLYLPEDVRAYALRLYGQKARRAAIAAARQAVAEVGRFRERKAVSR